MKLPLEGLLIGRTLAGRYRVEAVEGRGGMSVVFRATDLTLGRPVAVKIVALPAADDQEGALLRERFRREAGSAASIPPHPNVVQVYDYGTDAEASLDFIVMELLQGRDLRQRLAQEGPPPAPQALRIILDAARGVAAGHRVGIVHRDVKPANVYLTGQQEMEAVRVLDFGIAKSLQAEGDDGTLTVAGQRPHSPAYASPEQMDAAGDLTAASDVYQLGLLGYETLTGQRPFTEEERAIIRAGSSVAPAQAEAWLRVAPEIRFIVERALRREPAERFPDASAFADALAEAQREMDASETILAPAAAPLSGPPVEARRPDTGAAVPTGRASPHRRVAVAAGVVALALLAWAALQGGDDGAAPVTAAEEEALDSTFLALQGSVLGSAASAPAPAAADPGGSAAIDNVIRAAVHDLNRAWVDGDIDRHVSHYASRVDYYNSRNLPRSGVRRDRMRDLLRYAAMRRIDVGDIQVEYLDAERRRALVRKEWDFRGEDRNRAGRGVAEYVFKQDDDDGRWYVVSEQLLSQSEVRTPTAAQD